jgi:hypothetical protein
MSCGAINACLMCASRAVWPPAQKYSRCSILKLGVIVDGFLDHLQGSVTLRVRAQSMTSSELLQSRQACSSAASSRDFSVLGSYRGYRLSRRYESAHPHGFAI